MTIIRRFESEADCGMNAARKPGVSWRVTAVGCRTGRGPCQARAAEAVPRRARPDPVCRVLDAPRGELPMRRSRGGRPIRFSPPVAICRSNAAPDAWTGSVGLRVGGWRGFGPQCCWVVERFVAHTPRWFKVATGQKGRGIAPASGTKRGMTRQGAARRMIRFKSAMISL